MRPLSMGLSIAMFWTRSVPDVHANYRADTCTGMVRETSCERLEMGFHGHEVSVRTSWRHFTVKGITLLRWRTRTQTWWTRCLLPKSRPTPVKRNDRFVLGICVANASSPDIHWQVWWGRKAVGFTAAADALWCQSWSLTITKFPLLLCKSASQSTERFAKVSSNTPSFTRTSNCLTFCSSSNLLPSTRLF